MFSLLHGDFLRLATSTPFLSVLIGSAVSEYIMIDQGDNITWNKS